MEEKVFDTKYGKCLVKNQTIDSYGYPWVELYTGEHLDHYEGTLPCGIDDMDDVILDQIDEVLGDEKHEYMTPFELHLDIEYYHDLLPKDFEDIYNKTLDPKHLEHLATRKFWKNYPNHNRYIDMRKIEI